MTFGAATARVLAPSPSYQPGDSASNDDSLVLHLSYAGHSALLEGDAEASSETAMLSLPPDDLASDLLKVGHHGSKSSTTPPFLARVQPHLAIISVGPYNSYHHPRWETLKKLQVEGAHTWPPTSLASLPSTSTVPVFTPRTYLDTGQDRFSRAQHPYQV